jgi:hypothetical protein
MSRALHKNNRDFSRRQADFIYSFQGACYNERKGNETKNIIGWLVKTVDFCLYHKTSAACFS